MSLTHAALGVLLLALAALAPRPARAAGFCIYDVTGDAAGRASAISAGVTNAEANLFNPSGLAFSEGYQFAAGGAAVLVATDYQPDVGPKVETELGKYFLPNMFASAKVSDRIAVGVGAFSIFGLGIRWPNEWAGREYTIHALIQTFQVNPNIAIRLLPNLSLGGGVDIVKGSVDFTNGLPGGIGSGEVQIAGNAYGFGGNVGLTYRIIPEKVHVALTYRSRVKLDFNDGKAHFSNVPAEFQAALVDQGGTASLTLPDLLGSGVMWRATPRLELGAAADVSMWSTYDKLELNFEKSAKKVMYRKNHASGTFRLGGQWETPLEGFKVRLGFMFDQGPAPDGYITPSLPESDRLNFSAGIGYAFKSFQIDLGYLACYFLPTENRTSATQDQREGPDGKYNTLAQLIVTTLSFKFGQPRPKAAASAD